MIREREEIFEVLLSWLLGIVAGSLISVIFFGFVAFEAFLICVLIGCFLIKWLIRKRKSQPIIV